VSENQWRADDADLSIKRINMKKIQQKTDVEKAGLKGKVQSVRTIECDAIDKFGKIKGKLHVSEDDLYDTNGNPIEENDYKPDGNLDYKCMYEYEYKYDFKGNRTEQIRYRKKPNSDREADRITERTITYYE
jgi:hypothetical protein